jgi:cell division protein FtsN
MSRFDVLLERYRDAEETAAESEELAALLRGDPERRASLYDALMLEADLYDSYAGIAQVRAARRNRGSWSSPRLVMIWAAAVFLFVAVAVLLILGRPTSRQIVPAAPRPGPPKAAEPPPPEERRSYPPPAESPREKEHEEPGSKRDEIEREYQKGLREVERKRAAGKAGEAEEKLREIEREREKQLRRLEQRGRDR